MKPTEVPDSIVREFLRRNLDRIKQVYAPAHLMVFGSRARGSARQDSDIDIVVVSDRFAGIPYVDRIGHFLNKVKPEIDIYIDMDVLCYTPEEFEVMLQGRSSFVRNAVAQGIRIE